MIGFRDDLLSKFGTTYHQSSGSGKQISTVLNFLEEQNTFLCGVIFTTLHFLLSNFTKKEKSNETA